MHHAGVYIHIPFCRSRCSYCDFATGTYESSIAEDYVRQVVAEIKRFETTAADPAIFDTIYFGGGTPSLLNPDQVASILIAVRDRFRVLGEAEVTMEMNPGTLTPEMLRAFRELGVNRASFGAQTFNDRELQRLGRRHTADDVRQTIDYLRSAGFENTSFDLIAGLPAQTLAAWETNLKQALALRPEHLSLYLLEVHEGTPLADQIRRGAQPQPDDDLAAEMYKVMVERTATTGYRQYEISNFCLEGFESRHNSKYWNGAAVFGFGCSAHSYDGRRRRWSNERDAAQYIDLIKEKGSAVVDDIALDERDVRAEALFLGLRLMRGVRFSEHRARFGIDIRDEHGEELTRLHQAGLIEIEDDLLRLTPGGAILSNEVFAAFV